MKYKKEIKRIRKDIDLVSNVIGSSTGAAIGGLVANIPGAVLGSMAGAVVQHTLGEFAKKWITPKELERIGTAAEKIIEDVQSRLDEGHEQRNDGFLEIHGDERSRAEELFEGSLLKCRNEFEERKIPFIANIFTSVIFDSTIHADVANQILSISERMTYKQICMVSLIGKNQNNVRVLRTTDSRQNFEQTATEDLLFLIQDFRDLDNYGLIDRTDRMSLMNFVDPAPSKFVLTNLGRRFFSVLGLNEMDEAEFTFEELLK